jgi:hypothetical protein
MRVVEGWTIIQRAGRSGSRSLRLISPDPIKSSCLQIFPEAPGPSSYWHPGCILMVCEARKEKLLEEDHKRKVDRQAGAERTVHHYRARYPNLSFWRVGNRHVPTKISCPRNRFSFLWEIDPPIV